MKDCIFCKIVAGEIPSHKIYEDEFILAFLDISQTTKGHTLVIPKVHRKDIFEMTPDEMAKLHAKLPNLASALVAAFDASGLNVVNNNKESAGQTVFHYHVHLIPRYDSDAFEVKFKNHMSAYTQEDLANIATEITRKLEN